MKKFRNKYRIESNRLQNWDYGWNANYFITICTANRKHYFGNIFVNYNDYSYPTNIMQLSKVGKLAHQFWLEIPNHFSFAKLDAFIVMPNHVHGILVIDKPFGGNYDVDHHHGSGYAINRVSTGETGKMGNNKTKSKPVGGITGNKNPMLHKNLSRVIRWYKGRTTFESRKIDINFKWQANFHDHIIRTPIAYKNIRRYIQTNPQNWDCNGLKD